MNNSLLKVCLFDGVKESAIDVFKKAGFTNIHLFPDSLPEKKLIKELAHAHIVGIRSKTKLSKEIIAQAKELLCIGRYGIGVDNIDLKEAEIKGIPVFNGPHASTRSVAEMVLGVLFGLFRQLAHKSAEMHQGKWNKSAKNCFEIRGKTLGLVGYGNIASQVSIMAEGLGMNVIYSDVRKVLPYGKAQQLSFEEVLQKSDVLSLHVPGGQATQDMMNKKTFAKMKKGSYLINLARGSVVQIDDLKEAMESGHILGAALDVFPKEPKKNEEFESALRGVPNVLFTPHIAGSTEESQNALGIEVSEKMLHYAVKGDCSTALNFPQIALSSVNGANRLIVIHKNQSGVLASINEQIAIKNRNITSEVLKTSGSIGVVVIEAETPFEESIVSSLLSLSSVLKCRILL